MKKKVALFYDENTENGRMILKFLKPFDKRKSDIVGRLILNWIAEHGATVPVEWLEKGGDYTVTGYQGGSMQDRAKQTETVMQQEQKEDLPHDKELVRAGLAAFMG